MAIAPFGNDPAKIERYQAFWSRTDVARPLVGFTMRGWFPLEEYAATRAWPVNEYLTPAMVVPEAFLKDEEQLLREGEILDDDIIRGDMPAAAAIPWLSGMLGSRLRIPAGECPGRGSVGELGRDGEAPTRSGELLVQEVRRVRRGARHPLERPLSGEPRGLRGSVRHPGGAARPHPEHPGHHGGARAGQAGALASRPDLRRSHRRDLEPSSPLPRRLLRRHVPALGAGADHPDAGGRLGPLLARAVSPVPPASRPLPGEPVRQQLHPPALHLHVHPGRLPGDRGAAAASKSTTTPSGRRSPRCCPTSGWSRRRAGRS